MEQAAQKLDAGAFKLWVYFAKNQNGYEFALSSSEVEKTFGMKIKQYNNAVKELIEKGYLVEICGNCYKFCESGVITKEDNGNNCVMPKSNNGVMPKSNNAVMPKSNNALLPLEIRNNINTTLDNTKDNNSGEF
jgi:ferredoxin